MYTCLVSVTALPYIVFKFLEKKQIWTLFWKIKSRILSLGSFFGVTKQNNFEGQWKKVCACLCSMSIKQPSNFLWKQVGFCLVYWWNVPHTLTKAKLRFANKSRLMEWSEFNARVAEWRNRYHCHLRAPGSLVCFWYQVTNFWQSFAYPVHVHVCFLWVLSTYEIMVVPCNELVSHPCNNLALLSVIYYY